MKAPHLAPLIAGEPAMWCAEIALQNNGIGHLPGLSRFWVVSRPDLVNEILLNRNGDFDKGGPFYQVISRALGEGLFTTNDNALWRRLHTAILPSLQQRHLRDSGVEEITARLWTERMARWNHNQPTVLLEEFKQHSIELLAIYMFGVEADSTKLAKLATRVFAGMAGRLFLPQKLPGGKAYARAIGELQQEIDAIIATRRRHSPEGTMLDALLKATPAFTPEQIRDQVMTILMAGHDSTATMLAWTFVRLSERKELYVQLRDIARDTDDPAPLRTILRAVAHERPPFPMFPRNAVRETALGEYSIPKGSQILVSLQAMHNNPETWRGFDQVRIELEHDLDGWKRMAHRPFGHGQRRCPGEHFAMQTAQIILALMLREYRDIERVSKRNGQRSRYHMTAPPRDGAAMWLRR